MELIKYLEYAERKEKSKKILDDFGPLEGVNILKEIFENGYADSKDGKLFLTELGKSKLLELRKVHKGNSVKLFFKHPLVVGILVFLITFPLAYYLAYSSTIKGIDYENTLSVNLYGKSEITLEPTQSFEFNGITIYNPTDKKVVLKNTYIDSDYEWTKWNKYQKVLAVPEVVNDFNQSLVYDTPELQANFIPYMSLESGETSIINGYFQLTSPEKEGDYSLTFYVETLDGKKFYINRPLIIHVVAKE